MDLGELKPILTALVLPPAGPLLLIFLGILMAMGRRRAGMPFIVIGMLSLWLLSCNGVAVWLSQVILQQPSPLTVDKLRASGAQAVIVLGGGTERASPEYDAEDQLSVYSAARLRYGFRLAQRTGLPLGFAGGRGWSLGDEKSLSEAEIAARTAKTDYGVTLRWVETQSRDTGENARMMAALVHREGIGRVAVVTNAWHMARATREFELSGLQVVQAPMGYIAASERPLLEWIPSTDGLTSSRRVLREWLALRLVR